MTVGLCCCCITPTHITVRVLPESLVGIKTGQLHKTSVTQDWRYRPIQCNVHGTNHPTDCHNCGTSIASLSEAVELCWAFSRGSCLQALVKGVHQSLKFSPMDDQGAPFIERHKMAAQEANIAQKLFCVVADTYDSPQLPEPENKGGERQHVRDVTQNRVSSAVPHRPHCDNTE